MVSEERGRSHSASSDVDVTVTGSNRRSLSTGSGKVISMRVQMLDDSITLFQIQTKAIGQVLFDQVCRQLSLLESDYFGLEYQDTNGTKFWLDLEKPISRQLNFSLVDPLLRFVVKFYTADPTQLEEEFTRYLFGLEIKRDLAQGILHCHDSTAALLASYIVQAECGDFASEDYPDSYYLSAHKFVPHQDIEMEKRIMENHKKHIGQTPAEADLNLLETARRCELYGVRMHPAKDHEGVPLSLAVAHQGVCVFQQTTKINLFSWAKIRKLSFKRKKFLIKLHTDGSQVPCISHGFHKDMVEFVFEGRNECKSFWKKCVEHHAFFRCINVKNAPRQKAKIFSRGSSFRYSGRTQKQIIDYVRENYVRRQSFQRSQSFRHASPQCTSSNALGNSNSLQPLAPVLNETAGSLASMSVGHIPNLDNAAPVFEVNQSPHHALIHHSKEADLKENHNNYNHSGQESLYYSNSTLSKYDCEYEEFYNISNSTISLQFIHDLARENICTPASSSLACTLTKCLRSGSNDCTDENLSQESYELLEEGRPHKEESHDLFIESESCESFYSPTSNIAPAFFILPKLRDERLDSHPGCISEDYNELNQSNECIVIPDLIKTFDIQAGVETFDPSSRLMTRAQSSSSLILYEAVDKRLKSNRPKSLDFTCTNLPPCELPLIDNVENDSIFSPVRTKFVSNVDCNVPEKGRDNFRRASLVAAENLFLAVPDTELQFAKSLPDIPKLKAIDIPQENSSVFLACNSLLEENCVNTSLIELNSNRQDIETKGKVIVMTTRTMVSKGIHPLPNSGQYQQNDSVIFSGEDESEGQWVDDDTDQSSTNVLKQPFRSNSKIVVNIEGKKQNGSSLVNSSFEINNSLTEESLIQIPCSDKSSTIKETSFCEKYFDCLLNQSCAFAEVTELKVPIITTPNEFPITKGPVTASSVDIAGSEYVSQALVHRAYSIDSCTVPFDYRAFLRSPTFGKVSCKKLSKEAITLSLDCTHLDVNSKSHRSLYRTCSADIFLFPAGGDVCLKNLGENLYHSDVVIAPHLNIFPLINENNNIDLLISQTSVNRAPTEASFLNSDSTLNTFETDCLVPFCDFPPVGASTPKEERAFFLTDDAVFEDSTTNLIKFECLVEDIDGSNSAILKSTKREKTVDLEIIDPPSNAVSISMLSQHVLSIDSGNQLLPDFLANISNIASEPSPDITESPQSTTAIFCFEVKDIVSNEVYGDVDEGSSTTDVSTDDMKVSENVHPEVQEIEDLSIALISICADKDSGCFEKEPNSAKNEDFGNSKSVCTNLDKSAINLTEEIYWKKSRSSSSDSKGLTTLSTHEISYKEVQTLQSSAIDTSCQTAPVNSQSQRSFIANSDSYLEDFHRSLFLGVEELPSLELVTSQSSLLNEELERTEEDINLISDKSFQIVGYEGAFSTDSENRLLTHGLETACINKSKTSSDLSKDKDFRPKAHVSGELFNEQSYIGINSPISAPISGAQAAKKRSESSSLNSESFSSCTECFNQSKVLTVSISSSRTCSKCIAPQNDHYCKEGAYTECSNCNTSNPATPSYEVPFAFPSETRYELKHADSESPSSENKLLFSRPKTKGNNVEPVKPPRTSLSALEDIQQRKTNIEHVVSDNVLSPYQSFEESDCKKVRTLESGETVSAGNGKKSFNSGTQSGVGISFETIYQTSVECESGHGDTSSSPVIGFNFEVLTSSSTTSFGNTNILTRQDTLSSTTSMEDQIVDRVNDLIYEDYPDSVSNDGSEEECPPLSLWPSGMDVGGFVYPSRVLSKISEVSDSRYIASTLSHGDENTISEVSSSWGQAEDDPVCGEKILGPLNPDEYHSSSFIFESSFDPCLEAVPCKIVANQGCSTPDCEDSNFRNSNKSDERTLLESPGNKNNMYSFENCQDSG